jgi:hypothetical protein
MGSAVDVLMFAALCSWTVRFLCGCRSAGLFRNCLRLVDKRFERVGVVDMRRPFFYISKIRKLVVGSMLLYVEAFYVDPTYLLGLRSMTFEEMRTWK